MSWRVHGNRTAFANFVWRHGGNTGHFMIASGYRTLIRRLGGHWPKPTAASWSPVRTILRQRARAILTTSILTSRRFETEVCTDGENFTRHRDPRAFAGKFTDVIGLGLNGLSLEEFTSDDERILIDFLHPLVQRQVRLHTRGEFTSSLLRSRLMYPGGLVYSATCPSVAAIDWLPLEARQTDVLGSLNRVLLTGAAVQHLDAVAATEKNCSFLVVPQSLRELQEIMIQARRSDIGVDRVRLYLPACGRDWVRIIQAFSPQMTVGSRLHSHVLSLALGIPSVVFGGDLRLAEVCSDGALPFVRDSMPLRELVATWQSFDIPKARATADERLQSLSLIGA